MTHIPYVNLKALNLFVGKIQKIIIKISCRQLNLASESIKILIFKLIKTRCRELISYWELFSNFQRKLPSNKL